MAGKPGVITGRGTFGTRKHDPSDLKKARPSARQTQKKGCGTEGGGAAGGGDVVSEMFR